MDRYRSFQELAKHEREWIDYQVVVIRQPASSTLILAPHGGGIETRTSEIARGIAAQDFNLYMFEGIKPSDNYTALHITSHCFAEPRLLSLAQECDVVISIHGCEGRDERVLLGGLDGDLKRKLAAALSRNGLEAVASGHEFPAIHPDNVCNRGRHGKGVQLEVSRALRGGAREATLISAVRSVLLPSGSP